MHSKIFQISEQETNVENYITADDFTEGNWFDYTCDMDTEWYRDALDYLPELLKDVCEVNGHELITKDVEPLIKEWREKLQEAAASTERISRYIFNIQNLCERTHLEIWSRFYLPDWSEATDTFGEFVQYIHHLGPGKKLYVGGIVDYHF